MSRYAVEFEDVSKHYPLYADITGSIKWFLFNITRSIRSLKKHRFTVFKGVSFKVEKGEAFGIIGRNGAGKSTILGLIAQVLLPSSGVIKVNGKVTSFLELGSGFHLDLTGRENIILRGVLMGLTKAEVVSRMDEIIEYSELGEFIDQRIRVYSSGMMARLGFSVVAHLNPEIILIDEVFSVGDMSFRAKCIATMREFRKMGVTIVFVSHAIQQIAKLCDRAMWIDDHAVKMIGEPREIIKKYTEHMVKKQ